MDLTKQTGPGCLDADCQGKVTDLSGATTIDVSHFLPAGISLTSDPGECVYITYVELGKVYDLACSTTDHGVLCEYDCPGEQNKLNVKGSMTLEKSFMEISQLIF